ncbi:MAG: 50S ribosomal protein L28 [Microgenomates bacterium OLB22]|nr:MAG: 50S ribosomal protein L28 [Microgenomates bacterium OLB22]
MAAICLICGKGSMYGRSHTHRKGVAGGRWKKRAQKTPRIFKANLQNAAVDLGGFRTRVRLCTKCIKRIKKDVADGKTPKLNLVSLQVKPADAVLVAATA